MRDRISQFVAHMLTDRFASALTECICQPVAHRLCDLIEIEVATESRTPAKAAAAPHPGPQRFAKTLANHFPDAFPHRFHHAFAQCIRDAVEIQSLAEATQLLPFQLSFHSCFLLVVTAVVLRGACGRSVQSVFLLSRRAAAGRRS